MYHSQGQGGQGLHEQPFQQQHPQINQSVPMPGLRFQNVMPQGSQQMSMSMAGMRDVDMSDLPMPDSDVQALPTLSGSTPSQTLSTPLDTMGDFVATMGAPGAGPMPTGFGMQNPSGTGSTLTEFTKRRNWSKLLLEELRDLMMVLSADGRIQHVSPSSKLITGYENMMLLGKFLADFVHLEDKSMFIREFNESIASGNQMRFFYRLKAQDGSYKILEAFGHPHLSSEAVAFGRGGAPYCRGYFMMSRPYPTKNTQLLDSFLEHKIENERLLKRIAELKKEEQAEANEQESLSRGHDGSVATPSESFRADGRDNNTLTIHDSMLPPARPGPALTRANLSEALASARPDSIGDKMARYEGATHLETIEMLTGLLYQDGERSHGISTGATSPALIRGDAGIAILADRDGRMSIDRKKKAKVADEYVCTDCGTLDSPEWRKGPSGPKTLCNACGLRWAKKEKKRHQPKSGPPELRKHASTSS